MTLVFILQQTHAFQAQSEILSFQQSFKHLVCVRECWTEKVTKNSEMLVYLGEDFNTDNQNNDKSSHFTVQWLCARHYGQYFPWFHHLNPIPPILQMKKQDHRKWENYKSDSNPGLPAKPVLSEVEPAMIKYQPRCWPILDKRGHVPGPVPCQPRQDLTQDPVSKVCWYSFTEPRQWSSWSGIQGKKASGKWDPDKQREPVSGVPIRTLSFTDSVGELYGTLHTYSVHGYSLSQAEGYKAKVSTEKAHGMKSHQNKAQASKVPLLGKSQETH